MPPIGDKRRKKKVVKVKRKNKINAEKMSDGYSQPVDLSATFGESFPLNLDSLSRAMTAALI